MVRYISRDSFNYTFDQAFEEETEGVKFCVKCCKCFLKEMKVFDIFSANVNISVCESTVLLGLNQEVCIRRGQLTVMRWS